jgi:hypothetical protein
MSSDSPLHRGFIPPLVSLLAHAEAQQGSPPTEAEVLQIRGGASCRMMSVERARELAEKRGPDLDPERCWAEWQRLRSEGGSAGSAG